MAAHKINSCTYEALIQFATSVKTALSVNALVSERYAEDTKWLQQQLDLWNRRKIRVGVVGVTSSGKSTLINALLGEQILSTAVRPSSSQLVSCSKGNRKATIFFQNGKKVELTSNITMEAIRQYSDEKYNPNNRQAVAQLEFSTPSFALGDNVLLIDSPGLDAYGLEKHEKLTLETLIPTVDVCLYITTVKTNSDGKTAEFLRVIENNKCPVIIVQNMIDAVRATPDGKKSAQQVAQEHLDRMKKIIKEAKLDASKVCLCQLSAQKSLDAMLSSFTADEKTKSFVRWGYAGLITSVNSLINLRMPEINYQRMLSITTRVESIMEMDKALYSDSTIFKPFKFDGYSEEIDDAFKSACEALKQFAEQLDEIDSAPEEEPSRGFWGMLHILGQSSGGRNLRCESDAKEYFQKCISRVGEIENNIGKEIIGFNDYLREIINKMSLPESDMLSYNGIPSVPSPKVETKSEEYTVRVKQDGFFAGLGRLFWGWADVGYDYETRYRDVYDEESTKKALDDYLRRVSEGYSHTIDSWQRNAEATIFNINTEIDRARRSYDSKLPHNHKGEPFTEKEIALIKSISVNLENIINHAKRYTVESQTSLGGEPVAVLGETVTIEINKQTATYIGIEGLIRREMHQSSMRAMYKHFEAKNKFVLIVSWDYNSCELFMYNFYAMKLSGSAKEGCVYSSDSIMCLNNDGNLKQYADTCRRFRKNMYILVNTTQFGAAEKQLHESGILSLVSDEDLIVFVIQDFQEVINGKQGQGITESIQLMLEMKNRLKIKNQCACAINHANPIYNLALLQRQITPPKLQVDEIAIVDEIINRFKWVSPTSKKIIGEIIRGEKV